MKVLVLHGFRQSSAIIRDRLVRHLPKNIEYTVPNAPILLPLEEINEDRYGWFPLTKNQLMEDNVQISETDIEILVTYSKNFAGEYDAIIAYSQGCMAAQILIDRKIIHTSKKLYIAPIPMPKTQESIFSNECRIPVLIYIGKGDLWVPNEHTSFLDWHEQCHKNGDLLEIRYHSKGHNIPVTRQYRDEYAAFLTS